MQRPTEEKRLGKVQRPSKEQIAAMPLFEGISLDKIRVVTNQFEAQAAIEVLLQHSVVGFDTESKPTFQKGEKSTGPHIIQLATENEAFIVPTQFPFVKDVLAKIVGNPDILKVGFGLHEDKKIILRKFGVTVENTRELSSKVQAFAGFKQKVGARAAVALLFQQRLSKSAQRSNWAKFPLQEHQLRYAANDAYSALLVENKLRELEKERAE